MPKIGDRLRDKISGLEGIATGRTEYLNGCRQYLVTPETRKEDGEPHKAMWIDEQVLEVVADGVFADPFAADAEARIPATAGGPNSPHRAGE